MSFASPNLTWTGNLAVGASATITFSVTVNNPDTGNKILASTVTSATAGSNCASGSTDSRCAEHGPGLGPDYRRDREHPDARRRARRSATRSR